LKIGVITLFPEMFAALNYGVGGRAINNELLEVNYWNPRDFTHDKHRTVDDRPYGGGPGMLMKVQPLRDAIHAAKAKLGNETKAIYLSPQGQRFSQQTAATWAKTEKLLFIAGRYEGIDERLLQTDIDEEWSLGDYVLSGGEFAAMVIIDAIARLLPGALGHAESALQDSFSNGLLDCPHYTRPDKIDELCVPEVLLCGNHAEIERWRLKQALGKTWLKRPDLLTQKVLTKEEKSLLEEFVSEYTLRS